MPVTHWSNPYTRSPLCKIVQAIAADLHPLDELWPPKFLYFESTTPNSISIGVSLRSIWLLCHRSGFNLPEVVCKAIKVSTNRELAAKQINNSDAN